MNTHDSSLPPHADDMAGAARANGVLSGLRVIDFTAFMSGPYCVRWLADLGAEVIKVEPQGGEHMRREAPIRGGAGRMFGHMNAGKRSIVLDLKSREGNRIARELCLKSDIVVENFRPGVMKRLKLDAETLRAEKPRLIYCSISGFGQNTSLAHWPAFASIVHASSGFARTLSSYQDIPGAPANSGVHFADMIASLFSCVAIQSAVVRRERTGEGSTLDVNMMDGMMNLLVYEVQDAQSDEQSLPRIVKPIRAKDGYVVVAPNNDKNFEGLCDATGHPEWREDPLFRTFELWNANFYQLLARIEEWTMQYPAAECERTLMAAGVPCIRYRTVKEAMEDPQFAERGSFTTARDEGGEFLIPNLPFAFDGVRPEVGRRIPRPDEDADSILSELGLAAASEPAQPEANRALVR